jgi:hypothetical protein
MQRPSRREEFHESASAHWGTNTMDNLFPEGRPITGVPFPAAGRSKTNDDYDRDLVQKTLSNPTPTTTPVDPRGLRATQPSITRPGVDYYMHDVNYQKTGEPYADKHNLGNQWPVVYRRPKAADPDTSEDVLLSGHHRATSALLRGEQLDARLIEGDWGKPRRGK